MQSFSGNSGRIAHWGSLSWNSRNSGPWSGHGLHRALSPWLLGLFCLPPYTSGCVPGPVTGPSKPLPPRAQQRVPDLFSSCCRSGVK